MTDIAATPADPSQQIQIYFGGIFDQTAMGAPIYFWVIFLMGMGLICGGILVAYYRFFILDKIWDFVDCYKNHKPLALVRTRYRKAYLKSLKYIAQIFSDEDGVDKWFAPALETSSNLNGVDLIEAVDYYDWLQDPTLNEAIGVLVDTWNEKNPNDKIQDPVKFQKYLSEGKLSDLFDGKVEIVHKKGEVLVPAFFIVNISKIEQYLPRTRSSAMFGGYTQHLATDLGNKDKLDWKSYVLPVAALCTLMIIVSLVCYVIIKSA